MQSRALRILLLIVCICCIAATAIFARALENTGTARRAALRDFDQLAREATDILADMRAAQQGYVAFGQGADFWMSKVDAARERLTDALSMLGPAASSAESRPVLDRAIAAIGEFGRVDAKIREYLKTNEPLMAADIVFTEGGGAAEDAHRLVERARIEEHLAFDRFEADDKRLEIAAVGGTAGIVLLVTAMLALVPLKATSDVEAPSLSLRLSGSGEPPLARSDPTSDRDLPLRESAEPEQSVAETTVQPVEVPDESPTPALQSVAQICTDIGRLGDPDGLTQLLSQAAEVLDATGLVLWVGTASGSELRPVLAHGYSPEIVSRIPVVPRSANNAAAAAYRSGTLQIVQSQSGSASKGAIVAPVLSADGCVGVLSAEIRDGRETSATIQSLAIIFAAQLAGVVASSAAGAPEQRAAGSGAA